MKLDRTAFASLTAQEADHQLEYWLSKTMVERLEAAHYLNSVAYNFDFNNPPRMDRTVFSMRKHNC